MAERPMTDVMQQPCDPHVFLDERRRGTFIAQDPSERWIKMFGKFTGEVHGAKRVLKTTVLGRWVNPARALQLINIAQPLHPGRTNQRFFGDLALLLRTGNLNVAMDRISDQRRSFVFVIARLNHESALLRLLISD